MIYQFSHYPTDDGRRVRFSIARSELDRVRGAGFLDGEALRGAVDVIETDTTGEAMLVMTPATARVLVDAFAMVGGDLAVAARMLATALEGMALELRMSRSVSDLVRLGRRGRPIAQLRG